MFIHNFNLGKNKMSKVLIFIAVLLIILLLFFSIRSIYNSSKEEGKIAEEQGNNEIIEITSNDYTNFLKDCHANIDSYVGIKVKICGYVYRMPDFNNTQFVLSRTMVLNSANSGVVVGILTECKNAADFEDGEWVEVTGTISKGDYKGVMPILNVIDINLSQIPEDEYVYPPSL